MTTHSNILAWRIPWTEIPHGYSPWGCKESHRTEQLTLPLSPSPLPVSGKYQSTFEFSRFAFLDTLYRQKHQCSLLCLSCFIQHNVFEVYLCCNMHWYSIPFYCWILFCGMPTVHFVYSPDDYSPIHQVTWYRKTLTIKTIFLKFWSHSGYTFLIVCI